ncbi:MAG TPA: hypothetical protein VFQ53_43205 [Kofleriaceae bacterium]|nr:hypothetical protein [Kofleriaceae bacterium]
MGVDYYVERGCALQRHLTPPGFLAAMTRRRHAQLFAARELVIEGRAVQIQIPGGALPVHTVRDGQLVETTVTAADLDGELAPWAPRCDGCSARSTDQPFGCYGFIGYPIRAATEAWLVERAMAMGLGAAVTVNVLDQMGIAGDHVAQLRRRGRTFFESTEACRGAWQLGDGSALVVSSDRILDLALFALPKAFAQLFPLAAVLLGLVPVELATVDRIVGWMKFPRSLPPHLVPPPAAAEHQSFVDYFQLLIATARGGFELVVDG